MGDWPARISATGGDIGGGFASTLTSVTGLSASVASTAWPSANLAYFIPFRLAVPATVYKMIVGVGATTGGNFDVGIYDRFGNRLVSSGTTSRSVASTESVLNITDTVIGPGLYYLALSVDSTNTMAMMTPSGVSPIPLQKIRLSGVLSMASAFVLPATATFATPTFAPLPMITALFREN